MIGSERFLDFGVNSTNGSYAERLAAKAERICTGLREICDTVFPGVIYTAEHALKAMDLFWNKKVDFVCCIYLSWAQDFAWNRLLRDIPPIPLLHLHIIENVEAGAADSDTDEGFTAFLCRCGLVGTLEASGNNARYRRPMFEAFLGEWPEALERIKIFGKAARARSILKESAFGLMDCYNEVMWSTYVDPYSIFMQVGPELHFLSLAELADIVQSIPIQSAQKKTDALVNTYEVMAGVREDKLLASVRATMALQEQARRHKLDLLVLNDVDKTLFEQIGLRPGFYPLPDSGDTLMVPEGDIGGGIALYVLWLLSGRHVNYIEPFYIESDTGCFMAGHAGPNDYTDYRGHAKISRDVRFERTNYRFAGAPIAWYVFPEGRKTMLHCSQRNGRFQFVATLVDALECRHFIASYAHGRFRPIGQNSKTMFQKLQKTGVTQHFTIVDGDYLGEIKDLAVFLDFDIHII